MINPISSAAAFPLVNALTDKGFSPPPRMITSEGDENSKNADRVDFSGGDQPPLPFESGQVEGTARVQGFYDKQGLLIQELSLKGVKVDTGERPSWTDEATPFEIVQPNEEEVRMQPLADGLNEGTGLLAPERFQVPPPEGDEAGREMAELFQERIPLQEAMGNVVTPKGDIQFEVTSDGQRQIVVVDPKTQEVLRAVPPDNPRAVLNGEEGASPVWSAGSPPVADTSVDPRTTPVFLPGNLPLGPMTDDNEVETTSVPARETVDITA